MSLKQRTLQATKWAFVQQIGIQLINFAITLVLTRLLEPRDYGILGILTVFIAIGATLVNGGMHSSIIRTINPEVEDYTTIFTLNVIASIAFYLILYFLFPLIADWLEETKLVLYLRVYCLTIIIQSLGAMQTAKLTKELNFKRLTFIQTPSIIIAGVIGIFLAIKGFGVWSLIVMMMLQNTLTTIQLWIKSDLPFQFGISKSKLIYHFRYGYKLMLSGLLDSIFQNIYTFAIGKVYNISQLGFYTRAFSLRQLIINNISVALNKVTFSVFSEIQEDNIKLKSAYRRIMILVLYVIAPILLILFVVAEPFFRYVFTEKWLGAVFYFKLLCIGGIMYPLHAYNLNVLNVKGRSDLFLKLEIIKKAIVVVGIIISIQHSIEALLYFQLIFSFLSFVINSFYSGRLINYPIAEQLKDILPVFLIAIFSTIITLIFDGQFLNQWKSDLVRMLLNSFVFGLIYLAMSFVFKLSSLHEIKNIILRK